MRSLRDHWYPRPEWPAGARYLTWHLLPGPDGPLAAMVHAYHRVLDGWPGLDLVPPPWLHLTVQGLGPTERLSADQVAAAVADTRVRLAGLDPLRLTVRPAEVVDEGVVLTAVPSSRVAAIRAELRGALRPMLGRRVPGGDDDPVWPHLSLAYAHAPVPAAPLIAAVAGVDAGPVEVDWPVLSLIELRREDHLYSWEPVATVRIG